jgi:formamidopyrimidine-DNA glycosylase
MPELPEVELLVRHLAPRLENRTIQRVEIRRSRVLRPTRPADLKRALTGARFLGLTRRAKYLHFTLRTAAGEGTFGLFGHLGMTGRMFLQPAAGPFPKHTAVALYLGGEIFVFADTRYFGRFTLDPGTLDGLGPEPLGAEFTADYFAQALKRSAQAIKVKLLDQSLVAGLGNIYACEALFRARISPRLAARRLTLAQIKRLRRALRKTLADAIRAGGTVPLDWPGTGDGGGLFYFGRAEGTRDYEEPLEVYDREGAPCPVCRTPIRRLVQAARSTFYCPRCQCAAARL